MKEVKKILIVAAHPDDEVLGVGASALKFSREGYEVHVVILGEGITSRQVSRDPIAGKLQLDQLHSEVQQAGIRIGATSARVFDLPDNRFDSVPLLDVIKLLEGVIEKLQPTILFTHHAQDLNVDHRITHQAVMTACRSYSGQPVREIYAFETLSSTEWQTAHAMNAFCPTLYLRFGRDELKSKIEAMELYSSERREFPHPRSPKAIEVLAQMRGIAVGAEFAEAFEVIRIVK